MSKTHLEILPTAGLEHALVLEQLLFWPHGMFELEMNGQSRRNKLCILSRYNIGLSYHFWLLIFRRRCKIDDILDISIYISWCWWWNLNIQKEKYKWDQCLTKKFRLYVFTYLKTVYGWTI